MEKAAVDELRQALERTRTTVHSLPLSECDVEDVEELINRATEELESDTPNVSGLSTTLTSVAKSLRADPEARQVVLDLDHAMRQAKVPSDWSPGAF